MQLAKVEHRLKPGSKAQHYIADVIGELEGPTIIAVAGIHGNEATGIGAIKELLKKLNQLSRNLKVVFWD